MVGWCIMMFLFCWNREQHGQLVVAEQEQCYVCKEQSMVSQQVRLQRTTC
jgi:hypothetical protein